MTAFIELPQGVSASQVNAASVRIHANGKSYFAGFSPLEVQEYGKALMVKFDRQQVIDALGEHNGQIEISITGYLKDGTSFSGKDTLKVIQ